MRAALAVLYVLSAGPAPADAFLDLPIDCTPGTDCFIEDYMDVKPGPGQQDYTCGIRSRDGHRGTDFALTGFDAMDAGVAVLAAADGRVRAIRDGEPDIAYTPERADAIAGRECGNAVLMDHGKGYQTLYCHMRNGSVAVSEGQNVSSGTVLGLVGLSGLTNHPHLHITVLKDGKETDPFAPDLAPNACGATGETLWKDPVAYERTGFFTAGFTSSLPDFATVSNGSARKDTMTPSDALVLYGRFHHAEVGDRLHFQATGPQGAVFEHQEVLHDPKVDMFRAFGRRAPAAGWDIGQYDGTIRLMRGQTLIAVRHAHVVIE